MAIEDDIAQRWSIFSHATEIVDEKFEDGRGYALDALRTAAETINELKNLAEQLSLIDTSLLIPDITPPDVGDFTATPPTAPTIVPNFPNNINPDTEIEDAIHDKLLSILNNQGPAISETVETAIFERESERAALVHQDNLDSIANEWSKRGFTLPNAYLLAAITQAEVDYGNKRLDVSRDIAIKNFELSDADVKFAIQYGQAFLVNRIEIYKAQISAEIARIDSLVRTYLGEVEVYKGTAQVFTALADIDIKLFEADLRAELAKAELLLKNADLEMRSYEQINALRIEAVKAIGGINAQIVAGALSSVSASAQISASNSADYNYNTDPSF